MANWTTYLNAGEGYNAWMHNEGDSGIHVWIENELSLITTGDNSYATLWFFNINGTADADYLGAKKFGIDLPQNTIIRGFEVRIKCFYETIDFIAGDIYIKNVKLVKPDGTMSDPINQEIIISTHDQFYILSGSQSLGGLEWDYKDVNDPDFAIIIQFSTRDGYLFTGHVHVDLVQVMIYYDEGTGSCCSGLSSYFDNSLNPTQPEYNRHRKPENHSGCCGGSCCKANLSTTASEKTVVRQALTRN